MARQHKTSVLDLERGEGNPSFRAKCSCYFEGIFYTFDDAANALRAHLSMHREDGPQPPVPTSAIKVNPPKPVPTKAVK